MMVALWLTYGMRYPARFRGTGKSVPARGWGENSRFSPSSPTICWWMNLTLGTRAGGSARGEKRSFVEQKPEKSSSDGCNVPFMPAETLSDGKKRKSNKNRLRVRRVVHVPLREVSGICLGRSDNGRMFLIAVGDRAAKIAWFSLSGSEEVRIDWHTRSIAKLSGSKLPKHNPQIEAVCADGGGRILLLQETPPSVELIDPEALEAVASIDLVVEGRDDIARAATRRGREAKERCYCPAGICSSPKRKSRRR